MSENEPDLDSFINSLEWVPESRAFRALVGESQWLIRLHPLDAELGESMVMACRIKGDGFCIAEPTEECAGPEYIGTNKGRRMMRSVLDRLTHHHSDRP